MMAKYYNTTSMALIKVALLDYYGAYDVGTNPTGVVVHEDSASILIFSCSAVADKVIKLTGYAAINGSYGDAYSGSGVITNQVLLTDTPAGSTSGCHTVCADDFIILNVVASTINNRLFIIGKLTNGEFACAGFIASTSYCTNTKVKNTTTNENCSFVAIEVDVPIGAKRLIFPLFIRTAVGVEFDINGGVWFDGLYSISIQTGNTASKGTGYFITTSGGYTNNGAYRLINSLFVGTTN